VKFDPGVRRYIDGRMGGQVGQLYHLNPCDAPLITYYEAHLPSDEETAELPCTERSICYTQFGMASIITSIVRQELCAERVNVPKELTFDFEWGYICPPELVFTMMDAVFPV
jgi:hypothetical protein